MSMSAVPSELVYQCDGQADGFSYISQQVLNIVLTALLEYFDIVTKC